MTGNEIRALRECLDLSRAAFAQMCGVHLGTLYRWEGSGENDVAVDPLQRAVLHTAITQCANVPVSTSRSIGAAVAGGLLAGGTLLGLAVLLDELLLPGRSRARSRRATLKRKTAARKRRG